jgi:hypothetical protein
MTSLCKYSKHFKVYVCDSPGSDCPFFKTNGDGCLCGAEFYDEAFDLHHSCKNKEACLYAEEESLFV